MAVTQTRSSPRRSVAVPRGYAAQLWHPTHGYADLLLNINATELEMYKAMNGRNTLADIAAKMKLDEEAVKSSYRKFWEFDQVMFRT